MFQDLPLKNFPKGECLWLAGFRWWSKEKQFFQEYLKYVGVECFPLVHVSIKGERGLNLNGLSPCVALGERDSPRRVDHRKLVAGRGILC